jgi:hypothetical protein
VYDLERFSNADYLLEFTQPDTSLRNLYSEGHTA